MSTAIQTTREVVVSYKNLDPRELQNNVAGWIYMDMDGAKDADACVYIKNNGITKWLELVAVTSLGHYGDKQYSGEIDKDGKLLNFPSDAFASANSIWKAGKIDVFINGQELLNRVPTK